MVLVSALRWLCYNLLPSRCPECSGLLGLVLRRSAAQIGAVLRKGDPRAERPSDWLCCEDCTYAVALDLFEA